MAMDTLMAGIDTIKASSVMAMDTLMVGIDTTGKFITITNSDIHTVVAMDALKGEINTTNTDITNKLSE